MITSPRRCTRSWPPTPPHPHPHPHPPTHTLTPPPPPTLTPPPSPPHPHPAPLSDAVKKFTSVGVPTDEAALMQVPPNILNVTIFHFGMMLLSAPAVILLDVTARQVPDDEVRGGAALHPDIKGAG
jgi:hypothetical protein